MRNDTFNTTLPQMPDFSSRNDTLAVCMFDGMFKKIAVGTSSINLLLTFLAAMTLVKARLIPFSIRVFVFCLFICDGFILICCVLWAVSEVLGQLALRVDRMFIIIEWLLTASLSLDRTLVLDYPRIYLKYVGERGIKTYVCLLFITVILLRILTFNAGQVVTKPGCLVYTSVLCLCILIVVTCNLRIFVVCKRHIRQIRQLQVPSLTQCQRSGAHTIGSSGTVLIIMTAFVMLQTPFVIELLLMSCEKRRETRLFTYPCLLISCYSNTLLYCWRFKECRSVLMGYICRIAGKLIVLQESNGLGVFVQKPRGYSDSFFKTTYM